MNTPVISGMENKMAEYYLDRDRYKELKHFCLQYPKYKKLLSSYPLEDQVDIETALLLIEKTALDTSRVYGKWILEYVTKDMSYSRLSPPCDNYTFDYYIHKFFWLLSHRKGI